MPVTKTAKRALRASRRKEKINNSLRNRLEIALRVARKDKKEKYILRAISLADRAAKNKIIHKNKASRIKSSLSKLLPKKKSASPSKSKKKTKTSKS